jgi:hypothetical protein
MGRGWGGDGNGEIIDIICCLSYVDIFCCLANGYIVLSVLWISVSRQAQGYMFVICPLNMESCIIFM